MAWDAEVVVVVIGILAPPAALFGVFLRFATHNTQTMSKIKVTTPTVTPIANHELPEKERRKEAVSSERGGSLFAGVCWHVTQCLLPIIVSIESNMCVEGRGYQNLGRGGVVIEDFRFRSEQQIIMFRSEQEIIM